MVIGAKVLTSEVKLRASIAVVDAHAEVSCVVPIAAVSYIFLKVQASLDTTNQNPFVADTFVALDKAVLAVAKQFFEQTQATDAVQSINTALGKADSVVATEDIINILITFIRNFADSVGISDTEAIDFAKSLTDSYGLTDNDVFAFNKYVPDGVAMQDGADVQDGNVHHFEKYIMNMAFMNDANTKFFEKLLTDSPVILDTDIISFSKALTDSFGFTDSDTIDTALLKQEFVVPTDTLAKAFSKQISPDSIAFLEQIVKNPGKGLSDSAVPDDVGSLRSQGYCDITYFAEDYVGEARTFT